MTAVRLRALGWDHDRCMRQMRACTAAYAKLEPCVRIEWDVRSLTAFGDQPLEDPLTYGFCGYAVAGNVPRPCCFLDAPGVRGAVLGGGGLAVTSAYREPDDAAAFAVWTTGAEAQRAVVAPSGGQPGSSSAWDDPDLDAAAGGFYSGTRATIESAWMGPRDPWWPGFQLEAGEELTRGLARGESPERMLDRLEDADARRRV